MPDQRDTVWEAPPHTVAKHIILAEYVAAWFPIMLHQFGSAVYIDGFAGPGVYTNPAPGSPIIALTIAAEHSQLAKKPPRGRLEMAFIEERADRFTELQRQIAAAVQRSPLPGWLHQQPVPGTFEVEAPRIVGGLPNDIARAPRLIFVDPFGYGDIPLAVLAGLVTTRSSELLIFFNYADLRRFLDDPAKADALDRLFGGDMWRQFVPEPDPIKQREGLLRLYGDRLKRQAGFNHVWPFTLVDQNRDFYFLVFGTRSLAGLRYMKRAFWQADPERGRIYVDPKDPNQLPLLEAVSTVYELPGILQRQFTGQEVPIEDLEVFVLEHTDFVDNMHLRERTLEKMERADPPQIRAISRKKNAPGQYPKGTRIRFV